jgi:hypothetical protein
MIHWLFLLLLPQSTRMSGSTDLNLLHYIVAHVSAVLPGALAVDGERQAFRAACRRGTFDAGEGSKHSLQIRRHNFWHHQPPCVLLPAVFSTHRRAGQWTVGMTAAV